LCRLECTVPPVGAHCVQASTHSHIHTREPTQNSTRPTGRLSNPSLAAAQSVCVMCSASGEAPHVPRHKREPATCNHDSPSKHFPSKDVHHPRPWCTRTHQYCTECELCAASAHHQVALRAMPRPWKVDGHYAALIVTIVDAHRSASHTRTLRSVVRGRWSLGARLLSPLVCSTAP